jgi:trigger factor
MQTQVQNPSPLERKVDVAFPLQQVNIEIESRLKQLARTARVAGFRPGKVPLKVVERQYGGQIRQEVTADALQRAFSDMVRDQNYRIVGYPRFEQKPVMGDADQLEFTAVFEVYPEIQVNALTGATIKRPQTAVLDEDVDATIDILRKQRATFATVDRAAAPGDRMEIDFRGTRDGVAFDGGTAEGQWIVLGEGSLIKDFEDNLGGLRAGETKTFDVTFPDNYQAAELAGQKAVFEVTVKTVQEIVLPPVDEAFARQLGVADGDLATMRNEIRANLDREVKKRIQASVKEQAMNELLQRNPIDLPQVLVDTEIQRMAEGAREDLVQRGVADKDIALPPELFQEQARRRVALGLLLAELVRRENLIAKPEQVRSLLEEHAQSYEQPAEMVNWYYQKPERLKEVEALVVEDNVVGWLVDGAHVEDTPTPFAVLMGRKNVA